jgi:hypothetical protein
MVICSRSSLSVGNNMAINFKLDITPESLDCYFDLITPIQTTFNVGPSALAKLVFQFHWGLW